MSIASEAREDALKYADSILALVPQLIHMAVEDRRTHACWFEANAKHRLRTCAWIWRPWWRSRVRKHGAACAANGDLQSACHLAMASVDASKGWT